MSARRRTKLVLGRETLCRLSADELARVVGGFTVISQSCLCHSFVCSIGSDCHSAACKP